MTPLPVDRESFWQERLHRAKVTTPGQTYRVAYDVSPEEWNHIERTHSEILQNMFSPFRRSRVLDAGCGIGLLLKILPESVEYTGVDWSETLIKEARNQFPTKEFAVEKLNNLPFPRRFFDLAICRSLEGMVKDNLGWGAWREIENELMRVADHVVLLNYSEPDLYTITDSIPDPRQSVISSVEADGGRLTYRPGQDGTVELYDLYVDNSYRRQGVASRLVQHVLKQSFGTVYGFCRANNLAVRDLYEKLGFDITDVSGFYRGQDAFMAVYPFRKRGGT